MYEFLFRFKMNYLNFQINILIIITFLGLTSLLYNFKNRDYWKRMYYMRYIFIFPLLDVFSTFLFVKKYGVVSEINAIGRYFLSNYYYSYLILIIFAWLTSFILISFFYLNIYYIAKLSKGNIIKELNVGFKVGRILLIILYIIVLVINLIWKEY